MSNILIVEDDRMLVEIYQKKFSSDGYQVETASSGAEAIKKITKNKPDLVLLDLVMPEEDGFEVLRKVKQNPLTKDVRIIVFSNLSQEEDKEKAAALGAEGFITKSDFTPQEIVEKVHEILNIKTDDESQISKQEAAPSDSERSVKNGKRILLIEDEEVFADVFEKKLSETGFDVEVAKNGTIGAKKIEEQQYDIYIVNMSLPGHIGADLIDKIKKAEDKTDIPVIAFSNSKDDLGGLEKSLNVENDLILEKTKITPSQLVIKVKKLLGV